MVEERGDNEFKRVINRLYRYAKRNKGIRGKDKQTRNKSK